MAAVAAGFPSGPHLVPHYDVHGHQHHRRPLQDKSHLLTAGITHQKWLDPPPAVRTKRQLEAARSKGPDASYDFDGDGVIGDVDYFVGSAFDGDRDGRLTTGERRRAEKALESGLMEQYVNVSSNGRTGVAEKPPPPHVDPHRADPATVPKHATQTALLQRRKDEYRDAASASLVKRNALFDPVSEPHPPNATTVPRSTSITHIHQRVDADHKEARVRAGLLPENTATNPERELRSGGGMGYVEEPYLPSRSALLDTRRAAMKHDCEYLRAQSAELRVPQSVRKTAKDTLEYEFRRGVGEEAMTFTKLKDARRCDRVEYDMSHFALRENPRCCFPKFSESDVPYWTRGVEQQEPLSARSRPMSRTASEPTFKVTDVPFASDPRGDPSAPSAEQIEHARQQMQEYPKGCLGNGSKKRWTAEMLDRGQGPNRPRLFDSIPVLRVGPRDLEELDFTSTLAPVREMAQKRKRDAVGSTNPLRSQLWRSQESAMDAATLPSCVAAVGAGAPGGGGPPGGGESPLLDIPGISKDARSRANSKGSSYVPAGPGRPGERSVSTNASVNKVSLPVKALPASVSEPALRTAPAFHVSEPRAPQEPRFFGGSLGGGGAGSTLGGTGVRCGGFQRAVRAPHPPPPARGAKGKSRHDRSASSSEAPTA